MILQGPAGCLLQEFRANAKGYDIKFLGAEVCSVTSMMDAFQKQGFHWTMQDPSVEFVCYCKNSVPQL